MSMEIEPFARPRQPYAGGSVHDPFAPTFFNEADNKTQRYSEPPQISAAKALVDYPRARRETKFEPLSAFTPAGTEQLAAPRVIKLDLSVLRANVLFEIGGNVLWYQRSTNISDLVTIRYNNQLEDGVDWQPGNGLGGYPFDRLFITNAVIAGAFASLIVMSIPGQKLLLL